MLRNDHIFMATTDNGPNECAARRLIASEISTIPNVYYFDQSCLEHSPHLVVIGSLNLADELLEHFGSSWRYWSSLAMFAHTARDVAKPLYQNYAARWGPLLAKQAVKAIFPRPIAQRWNRIHELERRIQDSDFLKLAVSLCEVLTSKWVDLSELPPGFCSESSDPAVFSGSGISTSSSVDVSEAWTTVASFVNSAPLKSKEIAGPKDRSEVEKAKAKGNGKHSQVESKTQDNSDAVKKPGAKPKPKPAEKTESESTVKVKAQQGPHAELSKDSCKDYSVKMGKWRAKTITAVSQVLWGLCIDTMNKCRSPLVHLSNF